MLRAYCRISSLTDEVAEMYSNVDILPFTCTPFLLSPQSLPFSLPSFLPVAVMCSIEVLLVALALVLVLVLDCMNMLSITDPHCHLLIHFRCDSCISTRRRFDTNK
jgi:hypothetical protein